MSLITLSTPSTRFTTFSAWDFSHSVLAGKAPAQDHDLSLNGVFQVVEQ